MTSNTKNLANCIEQSLDVIINDFKPLDDHRGGWHQFLGSEKVGNVATSQALLLLEMCSAKIEVKEKAINFLTSNQIKSKKEFNNGGWAFISNIPDVANTESTCWSLQALYSEKHTDSIINGIKWLEANFIKSEKYSGWGPTNKCSIRTYSTCNVLNTFVKLKHKSYQFEASLDTIKRTQNLDGGWGDKPESISTLSHTSHAVITLLNCGIHPSNRSIQKAISWITNILKSKSYENTFSMGYLEMFDFAYETELGTKIQRITFYHMPVVYAVRALIKVNYTDGDFIFENIFIIMKKSDLGVWSHPLLLEKPLWAIYDVLMLFKEFLDSSYAKQFDSVHLPSSTKKKYDVIIFTVVPVEFKTLSKLLNFAPNGKKEDFAVRGFWYYEHQVERNGARSLNCLITMVGSAGDVGCYSACSTAFEKFDCDFAILCGIAAGNKEDIKKYSVVIADAIVAYEFQRLEEKQIKYRPKNFQPNIYTNRMIEKVHNNLEEWHTLIKDFAKRCGVKLKKVKKYSIQDTKLKTGSIASGAKLIADSKTLEILKEKIPINKGIIAAEMEGSGFAPCCIEYIKEWLVIRGISDYGEDDKNDPSNKEQQPLAVAVAAATMIYYLKYLHRTKEEREN